MREPAKNQFTHSHVISGENQVIFKCSNNIAKWPWLALHPLDPIVVQTIHYWASVESGEKRGSFDPTKWSALTQTEWECGEAGVGHAVRGISDLVGTEAEPRYQMTFYDAHDALVYRMSGEGVVFQNRDFEGWRAKAKAAIKQPISASDFDYASADTLGMSEQKLCFLSSMNGGETPSARGLITAENGFIPHHPHHSGSGDHVNSNHLADIGRQFVQALMGGRKLIFTSGNMTFKRYVELGQPFEVKQMGKSDAKNAVSMEVTQADRLCSEITLTYQDAE